jgi:hypothetical protein
MSFIHNTINLTTENIMQEPEYFNMIYSDFPDIVHGHLAPALSDTEISNLTLVNKRLNALFSDQLFKNNRMHQRLETAFRAENIPYTLDDFLDILTLRVSRIRLFYILSGLIKIANDEAPIYSGVPYPTQLMNIKEEIHDAKNETLCRLFVELIFSKLGIDPALLSHNWVAKFGSYEILLEMTTTAINGRILIARGKGTVSESLINIFKDIHNPISRALLGLNNWKLGYNFTEALCAYELTLENRNTPLLLLFNLQIRKLLEDMIESDSSKLENLPNHHVLYEYFTDENYAEDKWLEDIEQLTQLLPEVKCPLVLEVLAYDPYLFALNPKAVTLISQNLPNHYYWDISEPFEIISDISQSDYFFSIPCYFNKYGTDTMRAFLRLDINFKKANKLVIEELCLPLVVSKHQSILLENLNFNELFEIF